MLVAGLLSALVLPPIGAAAASPAHHVGELPADYCAGEGTTPAELIPVLDELQTAGIRQFRDWYAGLTVCGPPERIVVFRIPQRALDRELRRIGRKHQVRIELAKAPISYARMQWMSREVFSRGAEMEKSGAIPATVSRRAQGYVVVRVEGDLAAAHRVLHDLDHLYIRPGTRPKPA